MHYNWAGDVIFRDTVLPNKRFVIGSPQQPVATDIRDWLHPTDSRLLRNVIAKVPGMPGARGLGDFDRRAHALWAYVAASVRYDFDKDQRGYDDFWLTAEETLALGIGDCEDTSILLATLMVVAGISPYAVRVVLGHFYEGPKLLGSHAWVVYLDEFGIWRLLESTLDAALPFLPAADSYTCVDPRVPRRYIPDFCFNGDLLWWIRPPVPQIAPPPGLDDYLRRRQQRGIVNVPMTPQLRQELVTQAAGR